MATEGSLTTLLVQEIVSNAAELGLVWNLRPATVISADEPTDIKLVMDGDNDDTVLNAISFIGVFEPYARVMTVVVPPSGLYVIGHMDNHATSGLIYQAGFGLVLTAGDFHVQNFDGYLDITSDSIEIDPSLLALIAGAGTKFLDTTVGDGVSTTIDIVHGISGGVTHIYGSTLMDNATGQIVTLNPIVLSSTTVRLVFGAAPALNAYSFGFTY